MVQGIKYPFSYYDSEEERTILEADEQFQDIAYKKAEKACKGCSEDYNDGFCSGYILAAIERDSIARQEEREKFFRACCETCYARLGSTQCKEECERLSKIRKMLEE